MYLSIIIPAYNEGKRIGKTLKMIHAYLKDTSYTYEVLVVNDGSKDDTRKVVEEAMKSMPYLHLLDLPKNGGKGYAVQQGILASKGSYCLFTDADNSTSIDQVEKLFPYLMDGYDIVVSSRHAPGAKIVLPQSKLRIFLGSIFRLIVKTIVPLGINDTQNGFKLFTRAAAFTIFSQQRIFRWAFDVEVLAIAKRLGFKAKEVGIHWINNDQSQMRLKGMIYMLLEILVVRIHLWTGTYYRPVNIPIPSSRIYLVNR